jgi:alpha-1,2-mannosyltransferase
VTPDTAQPVRTERVPSRARGSGTTAGGSWIAAGIAAVDPLVVAVVALLALIRVAGYLLAIGSPAWAYDFAAYHGAAARLLAGEPLYDPALVAVPFLAEGPGLYLYPPPFAALMVPVAALLPDPAVANLAWSILGAASIVAAVALLARGSGARPTRLAVLALVIAAFPPTVQELVMGNVHLQLLLLLAIAVAGARRDDRAGDLLAGVAIGLAAIVKLYPLALLAWFVLARRPWPLVSAAATIAVVALATLPVVGVDAWRDYLAVMGNMSPLVSIPDATQAVGQPISPSSWLAGVGSPGVTRLIVLAGAGLAALAAARGRDPHLALVSLLLIGSAVAPGAWFHYLALGLGVVIVSVARDVPPIARVAAVTGLGLAMLAPFAQLAGPVARPLWTLALGALIVAGVAGSVARRPGVAAEAASPASPEASRAGPASPGSSSRRRPRSSAP